MKRYKQHRAGRRLLADVFAVELKSHLRFIHYSCESFYDPSDGSSPRITSIAIRHHASGQTRSFSIHQVAERCGSLENMEQQYDDLERTMLNEFFDYVKEQQDGTKWIHWNMRDANYGFAAIEHRLRVLGDEPVTVRDSDKVDLSILLSDVYGRDFAPHPRLTKLVDLNGLSRRDFMTGAEEACAFENKEYVKLHQSTLRKTELIARLASLAAAGELKAASTWRQRHGVSIAGVNDMVRESKLGQLDYLIGLPLGIAAAVIAIWAFFA